MSVNSFVPSSKSQKTAPAPRVPRKRKRKRKPQSAAWSLTAKSGGSRKGAEIRARIAANRAKRLAIADAMKREAGVTEHTVHKEDFGGLAYIGTGRIHSPEGRKIVQLYTLAHECGHIFLHNAGEGYWLPGHIKEFEAESYAHQAVREHGMTMPRKLTKWGRDYVASWIAKDRAANIPIDPRALAYAAGRLSPYEPLRMVPSTWKTFRSRTPASSTPGSRTWLKAIIPEHLADEIAAVLRLVAGCTVHGTTACMIGLAILQAYCPMPEIFPKRPGETTLTYAELLTAGTGGLLIANLALLVRTMMRVR